MQSPQRSARDRPHTGALTSWAGQCCPLSRTELGFLVCLFFSLGTYMLFKERYEQQDSPKVLLFTILGATLLCIPKVDIDITSQRLTSPPK